MCGQREWWWAAGIAFRNQDSHSRGNRTLAWNRFGGARQRCVGNGNEDGRRELLSGIKTAILEAIERWRGTALGEQDNDVWATGMVVGGGNCFQESRQPF
jgi:hypothetical protein